MAYFALGNVRHNGKKYRNGDPLPTLDKEHAERLLNLGVIEGEAEIVDDKPIDDDLLSIEGFGKLSAAEQKEQLEACDLVPGPNETERIQQYTEWHAEQVKGNDDPKL